MNSFPARTAPSKPHIGPIGARIALALGSAVTVVCVGFAVSAWSGDDDRLSGAALVPIILAIMAALCTALFMLLARRQAADYARRLAHADEPWTWRPEWRKPAIAADESKGLWVLWVWAMFCTAVSGFASVVTWMDAREQALLSPIVIMAGVFLVGSLSLLLGAAYLQLQRFKYGKPRFIPAKRPGVIGGTVSGRIEIPGLVRLKAGETLELVLRCERAVTTGVKDSRQTSKTTVWSSTQQLPVARLHSERRSTTIPVEFDIPWGLPESSCVDDDPRNRLEWQLQASAKTPGVDFRASFTIPVFMTDSSRQRGDATDITEALPGADPDAALAAARFCTASARALLKQRLKADRVAVRPSAGDYLRAALPNLIPAFGVVFLGWSVSLILLLYWLENLIGSILWNRLIRRHEAATHLRGHYRNQLGVSSNGQAIERFASEHFAGTVIFTLGHGLFLFVFAFLILDGSAVLEDLPWVLLLAAGIAVAAFVEIQPLHRGLERRSFAWLREQARISTWPIVAMHLGVIFGGMALGGAGVGLALVFIALRVGVDLMRVWHRKNPVDESGPPPARPEGMDEAVYALVLAAHERTLRDEEVCPPEERGLR